MIVDAHVHLHPDRLAEAIRRWFDTHAWDIRYRCGVDEAMRTLTDAGPRPGAARRTRGLARSTTLRLTFVAPS
jgi:hypothetical protein